MLKKWIKFYLKFYYPKLKKVFQFLSWILILVLILEVFVIFAEKVKVIPYILFVVESESMEPELEKGDLILVQRKNDYHIDDVITFYPNSRRDKTYTHRLIRIDNIRGKNFFRTKGDNNQVEDPFLLENVDIVGKVVYEMENIGKGILFLRSVPGIILFMIVPCSILFTIHIQEIIMTIEELLD
jgi:signal peptidase I